VAASAYQLWRNGNNGGVWRHGSVNKHHQLAAGISIKHHRHRVMAYLMVARQHLGGVSISSGGGSCGGGVGGMAVMALNQPKAVMAAASAYVAYQLSMSSA